MNDNKKTIVSNKHDFMFLFSIKNGNPNGDPDADNRPRINDSTGIGIVTDVCIKSKIRKYIEVTKSGVNGYDIFGRSGTIANDVYEDSAKEVNSKSLKDVRPFLCQKFFDIRAFGGVLSTGPFKGDSDGALRGPVQLSMGESIDTIDIQQQTITRCYVTDKKDADKERTMGTRSFTPFGLYKMEGSVWVPDCKKTLFSENDLDVLFDAITNMFENDNASNRFGMALQKFVVFKHKSEMGNFPRHKLFESVIIKKKDGIVAPTKYSDYNIYMDDDAVAKYSENVEVKNIV